MGPAHADSHPVYLFTLAPARSVAWWPPTTGGWLILGLAVLGAALVIAAVWRLGRQRRSSRLGMPIATADPFFTGPAVDWPGAGRVVPDRASGLVGLPLPRGVTMRDDVPRRTTSPHRAES